MEQKNLNLDNFKNLILFCKQNFELDTQANQDGNISVILKCKKGSKIHIKKLNRGKFTSYCGGTVTSECIQRGKNSSDPKIRKRATFAANARKWKHQNGGNLNLTLADMSCFNTFRDIVNKNLQTN